MHLSQPFALTAAILLFSLSAGVASAQSTPAPAVPAAEKPAPAAASLDTPRKTASGLTIIDRKIGEGPEVVAMRPVLVHYTGWLYDENAADKKGKQFDSSVGKATPFGFFVGVKRVIAGWDEGVQGMKAGGKRTLIIPPDLGYGEKGAGDAIPANATLIFDIEFIRFAS
jgi:FKBP-type peptidyl-prolyl cis-trans isomerase FkpA